jgi:hypothetical protein
VIDLAGQDQLSDGNDPTIVYLTSWFPMTPMTSCLPPELRVKALVSKVKWGSYGLARADVKST